jgi:phytanoyl-CoA hydroxylase
MMAAMDRYSVAMSNPSFGFSGSLTPDQQAFLDEKGFIKFDGFLTPAEVDFVWGEIAGVQRQWLSEGRTKAFGIPIKYGKDLDGQRFVNRFAFASMYSPGLHEFVTSKRFQQIGEMLGPQFRFAEDEKDGLVVNHYVNAGGSRYKQLGWHTDGLRDLFYGKKQRPLWQIGLYLDDSPKAKGGLRVIPGTHKQGFLAQAFGKAHFVDHKPDPREVCIEASRGDLTIHDGRLWHRVARAEVTGEASRRRVAYLPFIDGPRQPKNESSATPLYHYLQRVTG